MPDSRMAQFATSDPSGSDLPFWNQRVYFDGVPRRRREIVATLAHTPYMTETAARLLLATAPVADGTPPAAPPQGWGGPATFWNEDQPRASNGRWGSGGESTGSAGKPPGGEATPAAPTMQDLLKKALGDAYVETPAKPKLSADEKKLAKLEDRRLALAGKGGNSRASIVANQRKLADVNEQIATTRQKIKSDAAAKSAPATAPVAPPVAPPATPAPAPQGSTDRPKNGEWHTEPARYAKDKIAVHTRSDTGYKSGAASIAEALGGKYTNREKAYLLPKTKEARFIALANGGWDASPYNGTLTPPASIDPQSAMGKQWAAVTAAKDAHRELIIKTAREQVTATTAEREELHKSGAALDDLYRDFTKKVASGKFDVDLGIKAGKKAPAAKVPPAAKDPVKTIGGYAVKPAAVAPPVAPPAPVPPASGGYKGAFTPEEESANTYRTDVKVVKPTAANLAKALKKESTGKFDYLGGAVATGIVSNGKYLAKLPEGGKDRDALMKAAAAHVAGRPGGVAGKVPDYQYLINKLGTDLPATPAQIVGHRDKKAPGGDGVGRSLVRDDSGNSMVVSTVEAAPVLKLWPKATMHIGTSRSYGSEDRHHLVFKQGGEIVGVVMGLHDSYAKTATVAGAAPPAAPKPPTPVAPPPPPPAPKPVAPPPSPMAQPVATPPAKKSAESPGLLSRAANTAGSIAEGVLDEASKPFGLLGTFGPFGPIHGPNTIDALGKLGGALAEGIGSLLGGSSS